MMKLQEVLDPNSCLNKARDDERIFVVLERDRAMSGTIRSWIQIRLQLGLNLPGDAQITEAMELATALENEWRAV